MFPLIAVLALSFFMTVPGFAQTEAAPTRCLRFAVVEAEFASGVPGTWPADARNWWGKDGMRKFPELCEVSRQDADFLFVWERKWTVEKISRPVNPGWDANLSGFPQVEWDCETRYGEEKERCTVRRIPPKFLTMEWEVREETVEQISVTIHREQDGQLVPMKTVVKKRGKPGKAAIDSALKFLRKKARKVTASNARP